MSSAGTDLWGGEFEHEVLTAKASKESVYQEAAFYHKPSRRAPALTGAVQSAGTAALHLRYWLFNFGCASNTVCVRGFLTLCTVCSGVLVTGARSRALFQVEDAAAVRRGRLDGRGPAADSDERARVPHSFPSPRPKTSNVLSQASLQRAAAADLPDTLQRVHSEY